MLICFRNNELKLQVNLEHLTMLESYTGGGGVGERLRHWSPDQELPGSNESRGFDQQTMGRNCARTIDVSHT